MVEAMAKGAARERGVRARQGSLEGSWREESERRARSTRRESGEKRGERGSGRGRERETRPRLARFWMGEGVSGGWSRDGSRGMAK